MIFIFISYSVNRQSDDNKDVNPSNGQNGYSRREKKTKTEIYNVHTCSRCL